MINVPEFPGAFIYSRDFCRFAGVLKITIYSTQTSPTGIPKLGFFWKLFLIGGLLCLEIYRTFRMAVGRHFP